MFHHNKFHSLNWTTVIFAVCFFEVVFVFGEDLTDTAKRPFLLEPSGLENSFYRENDPGPLLKCAVSEPFRNRSRYEMEWTKVVDSTPMLISRNGRLYSANSDYGLNDTLTKDGNYNLQIKRIVFNRDNGRFFCAVIDMETGFQLLSEPAKIIVMVPPQSPTITEQPSAAIRENSLVTFRCDSIGGNPSPTYEWVFENKTKVSENWYHSKYETGRSHSILQWYVHREDNRASLTCQVKNQALNRDEPLTAQTNRINVLYAPRLKIDPSAELNVEEGEFAKFACSADANPAATNFQWTQLSTGETFSERQMNLLVRRKHAGDFVCTATNSIASASEKIRLNVFYGPLVRIVETGGEADPSKPMTAINPLEGERLVVDCEVDANPSLVTVSWSGPNGFVRNGSRLLIDSINRSQTGNYTCNAWNTLTLSSVPSESSQKPRSVVRRGHSSVLVDVRHRPGRASIIGQDTSVIVGGALALNCHAKEPGNPPAKYRWTLPNSHSSESRPELNNARLKLMDVGLDSSGIYHCVAWNEVGEGDESTVDILVVEPPRIIKSPIAPKTFNTGDSDVSIECTAQGHPTPKIQWLKDGIPLTSAATARMWMERHLPVDERCPSGTTCAEKVRSVLNSLSTIDWTTKGNYTCVAENSPIAQVASSSALIHVIHEPVVLNERFRIDGEDGQLGLAAAEVGETSLISCLVSSRPKPIVAWTIEGVELSKSSKNGRIRAREVDQFYDGRVDEYMAILEIVDVREEDYGMYKCHARNGQTTRKQHQEFTTDSELEIKLQPKSAPQAPSLLQAISSGTNWITLEWKSGFDGGEAQMFELEYQDLDPYSGEPVTSGRPKILVVDPRMPQTFTPFQTLLTQNLTQLQALSAYRIRIRAKNSRGFSDWTSIDASTTDVTENVFIRAPESLVYSLEEHKLTIEPSNPFQAESAKNQLCTIVYVASSSNNGLWRALGCFGMEPDGVLPNIAPAQKFRTRICVLPEALECSQGREIAVDYTPFLQHLPLLPILLFCACAIASTSFIVLLLRRRFQKSKNDQETAAGKKSKGPVKRLNLDGSVTVERFESSTNHHPYQNSKTAPINSSQTDSGVFTLGSMSATAVAAISIGTNGLFNGNTRQIMDSAEDWQDGGDNRHRQPEHPYGGFNVDPCLHELDAASGFNGIVIAENTLHSNSSPEGTPPCNGGSNPNPYSKFFDGISALISGGGTRHNPAQLPQQQITTNGNGSGGRGSNDPLVHSVDSSADTLSCDNNGPAQGRIMREIIV